MPGWPGIFLVLSGCLVGPDFVEQRSDEDQDGYASDDCDDAAPDIHPGAPEHCDGVDEDCDGGPDDDAVDALVWYVDADGDGVGDAASTVTACEPPPGTVAAAGDCDDADPTQAPGLPEMCDRRDNDCDYDTTDYQRADAGAATFESIQAAVDAAGPGGTVTVCPGTYFENVVLEADMTLVSLTGNATFVDAGGSGAGITTQGGDVVIRGLGVLHASEGGIVAEQCTSLTVEDSQLFENEGEDGGGIVATCGGTGTVSITGSSFMRNHARGSGGALAALLGEVHISDSRFHQNSAHELGGALYLDADPVVIDDCTLGDNTADQGGGVWVDARSDLAIRNSAIASSTARYGAGMDLRTGGLDLRVDLSGTAFVGNHATEAGGALFLEPYADTVVIAGTFEQNEADVDGGAVFLRGGGPAGGQIAWDGPSFRSNRTRSSTHGPPHGGGAIAIDDDTVLVLTGGTFEQNSATDVGGAVASWGDFDISSSTFAGGIAERGAGVFVAGTGRLTDTTVDGGIATLGGAVYVAAHGSVTLDRSGISGGIAREAGLGAFVRGRLESIATDWPDHPFYADVVVGSPSGESTAYDWTGPASFVCDGATATCQ